MAHFQLPTIGHKPADGDRDWSPVQPDGLVKLHRAAQEALAHISGKWMLVRLSYHDYEAKTVDHAAITIWNLYPRYPDGIHADKVFVCQNKPGDEMPPFGWASATMESFEASEVGGQA